MKSMQNEGTVTKANIRPQRNNANAHTPRGMGMLEGSIERDGLIGAITTAADDEIFDGSARGETLPAMGFDLADVSQVVKAEPGRVLIIESDGSSPLVHRRTDIPSADDPRAQRLGVAANRVAEVNLSWSPGVLAELRDDADVRLGDMFTADELAEYAQPAAPEPGAGGDDFDATPDEDGPTRAQLGDLWVIGGVHRLLVGDCTDPANVARLMGGERASLCFTSPPYNVAAESSLPNKNKYRADRQKYSDDQHDNRSEDEYLQFLLTFTTLALENSEYVFVNVQSVAGNKIALIDYLYGLKKQYADTLIWDKLTAEPAMAHNVLNSRFEYIHVFSHKANRAIGTRDFRGTIENVYSLNSRQDKDFSDIHRATFPLEFPLYFTEQFTNANEIVLDMFLGTGTTLIAAHRTGRRCYGCELAPKYADVILRRAEAEGLTVELVPSS